ncbi:nucleotide exchange factor GrpE [Paraferrimonas haliotis]|uniref:Protein GrpE n=1 Tax=Paraferrimonas haliotis TaxID=2013866 RepID=A0AA37TVS8_9GAMM|nr:nucleotide exchange factor GrpE [Paraferrimonas haliotis]GLS83650.1 protein GrpE [Paraferrimonas haliotis]
MTDPKHDQVNEEQLEQQNESLDGEQIETNDAVEQVEEEQAQADPIATLTEELAKANQQIADQQDSVLRAKAEVDNIRRRAAIDVTKAKDFALEKFSKELLPVIDNLERALAVECDESAKAVHEGVELTLKSFLATVEKFGIKVVDPKGEAFNPDAHQAISMVPNPELPNNTVMDVMQKGYELNGRLLRPAMVIVSQGGAK